MAIDYSGFAIPKGTPRVVEKARKAKQLAQDERTCRAAVKARDKGKCRIPGCIDRATELHHIRYRSRGGKWRTDNIVSLCLDHHRLQHAGVINVAGNADSEIVITGDVNRLRFRL